MAHPTATGKQSGFTYIGVLIGVAILGAMLAALGTVWQTMAQREQEKELLFVGHQFRAALNRYYQNNQRYPMRLEQLVQDDNPQTVRRYLRKIYVDPLTRQTSWGLVTQADGQIVGVYSLSGKVPLKKAGFRPQDSDFVQKSKYSEWLFMAEGQTAVAGLAALTTASSPP
jgi:type II secretory pathway pseudopilin PulG